MHFHLCSKIWIYLYQKHLHYIRKSWINSIFSASLRLYLFIKCVLKHFICHILDKIKCILNSGPAFLTPFYIYFYWMYLSISQNALITPETSINWLYIFYIYLWNELKTALHPYGVSYHVNAWAHRAADQALLHPALRSVGVALLLTAFCSLCPRQGEWQSGDGQRRLHG